MTARGQLAIEYGARMRAMDIRIQKPSKKDPWARYLRYGRQMATEKIKALREMDERFTNNAQAASYLLTRLQGDQHQEV